MTFNEDRPLDVNTMVVGHVLNLEERIIGLRQRGNYSGSLEMMKDLITFVVLKVDDKQPFNDLYMEIEEIWDESKKITRSNRLFTERARSWFIEINCKNRFHYYFNKLQDLITALDYFGDKKRGPRKRQDPTGLKMRKVNKPG